MRSRIVPPALECQADVRRLLFPSQLESKNSRNLMAIESSHSTLVVPVWASRGAAGSSVPTGQLFTLYWHPQRTASRIQRNLQWAMVEEMQYSRWVARVAVMHFCNWKTTVGGSLLDPRLARPNLLPGRHTKRCHEGNIGARNIRQIGAKINLRVFQVLDWALSFTSVDSIYFTLGFTSINI